MGISPEAQAAFDALQTAYGQPLDVISGYRSPEYNRQVGGARNSQHTLGNAFDFNVRGMPIDERLALASLARGAGFRGFGFYDNTLHFDVGPSRHWGPSHRSVSTPDWAQAWVQENIGGAAPQGVPSMAMTPDPQPQGLMSRLFGGPADTPDTSPIDPYANLSRQQRMMLGFAALRDAGASFAGRDTDFFAQTLGGYEDARERERLRRQGELQNRATALQGLAQIQQQIAIARARGVQPSDAQLQLERYFTDMLTSTGGGLEGAAPMTMPTPEAVTPAAAAVTPAPEAAAVTSTPEAAAVTPAPEAPAPEAPAPETVAAEPKASDALLAEITELQEMQSELMRLGDDTTDIQQRITLLDRRYRDQLKVEQEAAAAAQELLATPDQLDLATANLARMRNIENASDEDLNRILGPVVSAIDDESPTSFQIARNIRVGEEGGALLAEIDQIIAGEFLIAFDQLKGGGQITNIEGQRAVKARQQLTSRNVSPEAYRQAAREIRMITENGLARAKGEEAPHSLEAISGGVTGGATPDGQTLTDDAAGFLGLAVQQ